MTDVTIGVVLPEDDDNHPRMVQWPGNVRIPVSGDYWKEQRSETEYVVADVQWRYQEPRPLAPMTVLAVLYLAENIEDCECGECECG